MQNSGRPSYWKFGEGRCEVSVGIDRSERFLLQGRTFKYFRRALDLDLFARYSRLSRDADLVTVTQSSDITAHAAVRRQLSHAKYTRLSP